MSDEPAFPQRDIHGRGMTLRDYFAAQALTGLGTWTPSYTASIGGFINQAEVQKARAEYAYAQADAMLAARSVTSPDRPTDKYVVDDPWCRPAAQPQTPKETRIDGMVAAFTEVADYLQAQGAHAYADHIRRRGTSLTRPNLCAESSGPGGSNDC